MSYLCERCANCLKLIKPRTIDTCGTLRRPKTYVDCQASDKTRWVTRAKEDDATMPPHVICGSFEARRKR